VPIIPWTCCSTACSKCIGRQRGQLNSKIGVLGDAG
jgi:hypothetical protein